MKTETIQTVPTHTPGPWEYQAGTIGNYNHGVIAMMPPKPESAANARLIAAAPELLAALVSLEAGVRLWMTRGVSEEDMSNARAAIARATGQPI